MNIDIVAINETLRGNPTIDTERQRFLVAEHIRIRAAIGEVTGRGFVSGYSGLIAGLMSIRKELGLPPLPN